MNENIFIIAAIDQIVLTSVEVLIILSFLHFQISILIQPLFLIFFSSQEQERSVNPWKLIRPSRKLSFLD